MRPGLALPNVERFTPVLHAILDAWPRLVPLDPGTLSPNTYVARLRDAIKAVREGHVVLPDLTARYMALDERPVVRELPDGIKVGPRSSFTKDALPLVPSPSTPEGDYLLTITNPTDDELFSVLTLAEGGHLPKPILLLGTTAERVTERAGPEADVGIVPIGDSQVSVM